MIADLSVNHVERFLLEAGHTAQRLLSDYGYDLLMVTYDEQGYAEPDLVYLQLKASETLTVKGDGYVFDLDIRDYNLWMLERMPVLLVLFDASRRRAFWLFVQQYFGQAGRKPRKGAKTVRLHVPQRQTISRRGIASIRSLKQAWMNAAWGE